MLQIDGRNASKFEFVMLWILLRSFRFCLVFECRASNESRAAPKWKVPESFKNVSVTFESAPERFSHPPLTGHQFSNVACFVIFEWFLVATRMLQCCRGLNRRGASHLLLCKEHMGPQRFQWLLFGGFVGREGVCFLRNFVFCLFKFQA